MVHWLDAFTSNVMPDKGVWCVWWDKRCRSQQHHGTMTTCGQIHDGKIKHKKHARTHARAGGRDKARYQPRYRPTAKKKTKKINRGKKKCHYLLGEKMKRRGKYRIVHIYGMYHAVLCYFFLGTRADNCTKTRFEGEILCRFFFWAALARFVEQNMSWWGIARGSLLKQGHKKETRRRLD